MNNLQDLTDVMISSTTVPITNSTQRDPSQRVAMNHTPYETVTIKHTFPETQSHLKKIRQNQFFVKDTYREVPRSTSDTISFNTSDILFNSAPTFNMIPNINPVKTFNISSDSIPNHIPNITSDNNTPNICSNMTSSETLNINPIATTMPSKKAEEATRKEEQKDKYQEADLQFVGHAHSKKFRLKSFLWAKPNNSSYANTIYSQLLPVLAVNLGSLSVGLSLGYTSVLLAQSVRAETGPGVWGETEVNFTLTRGTTFTFDKGDDDWIGWMLLAGSVMGGLASSLLGTYLGRRVALIVLTLPDLLGWVMVGLADRPGLILTSRFLCGLAGAGYIANIQIYVAEISQAKHRGWLSALTFPILTIGVLTMYIMGSLIQWPYVAAACTTVPILMFLVLLSLFDSPYWYFSSGQEKFAHASLEHFRGGDDDIFSEVFQIQEHVNEHHELVKTKNLFTKLKTAFTDKKYYTPFFILNFLFLLTSLASQSSLELYATRILASFSGDNMEPFLARAILTFLTLISSCLYVPLVTQYARRLVFSLSCVLASASLLLLGLALYSQVEKSSILSSFMWEVRTWNWLPLLAVSLYLLSTPLGLSSITVLYTAELFPSELRSLLSGLTVSFSSLSVLLVVTTIHPAVEKLLGHHGLVWLQAASCLAAVFFCLASIPETKNQELNQVPAKFEKWRKVTRASPWVTPMPSPSFNSARKDFLKSHMFTQ